MGNKNYIRDDGGLDGVERVQKWEPFVWEIER